jgi:creatinine amidohydrolase/Fe(II)-dependent formamide hydrolase-like protein
MPMARRSHGQLHDIDPAAPPFRNRASPSHPGPGIGRARLSDPHLDFSAFSSKAVVGSAAHASPALGEPLWHACVNAVADMLRLIDIDLDSVHVQATMPFEL